jgi:hypothetical protein
MYLQQYPVDDLLFEPIEEF